MKSLEEIIKNRLENYESELPESDFSEFQELLDRTYTTKHKYTISWVRLIPLAAASCLVLLFVFRFSREMSVSQEMCQNTTASAVEQIEMNDNQSVGQPTILISATTALVKRKIDATIHPKVSIDSDETIYTVPQATLTKKDASADTITISNKDAEALFPKTINERVSMTHRNIHVGKTIAGVAGGTGVVAMVSFLRSGVAFEGNGLLSNNSNNGGRPQNAPPIRDVLTGEDSHQFPLRTGVSVSIPFHRRWALITGIDYSLYSSNIGYSISGTKKQHVHYVGIPIRADYTLWSNRWFNVYTGGGVITDFCIGATLESKSVQKDPVRFALVAATGFQFNISKHLGLYVDPTLAWNVPTGNNVLNTYRSAHPLMFNLSCGIRFTFNR